MKRLLTIAAIAMLPTVASAETGYICVLDKLTGFSYENESWVQSNFTPDPKFVVRRPTRQYSRPIKWEVARLGNGHASIWCEDDFNEADNLFCEGIGEFRMNRKTLRLVYIYPIGYIKFESGQENANNPAIGIGRCTSM